MSFQYSSIFYDSNIFSDEDKIKSYNNLIKNIKNNYFIVNKIIYEKEPIVTHKNTKSYLTIDRNRYISEHNDKLLLFSTNSPSLVVTIWYNEYGTTKHVSVYNGKAILIDLYKSLHHSIMIQANSTLLSSILCDFQYFTIADFIHKHKNQSMDLNSHYTII